MTEIFIPLLTNECVNYMMYLLYGAGNLISSPIYNLGTLHETCKVKNLAMLCGYDLEQGSMENQKNQLKPKLL